MTLIGAPNGSGKSTWCAFLRTMLYGLDTRQRDRKGAPCRQKPLPALERLPHGGAAGL